MLESSVARTWSSWTGAEVCWIGDGVAVWRSGAEGEPGWTSTKKLPSRKMRGRILMLRVGVEREARVDPQVDDRPLAAAADVVHAGDLADVDPGDPHRRVLRDVVGALERRVDREVVAEGDRLGEGEVAGQGEDDDHHDARGEGRQAAGLLPAGSARSAAGELAHGASR